MTRMTRLCCVVFWVILIVLIRISSLCAGDPEGCNMNWNGAGAPHLTAASSFVMLYEW